MFFRNGPRKGSSRRKLWTLTALAASAALAAGTFAPSVHAEPGEPEVPTELNATFTWTSMPTYHDRNGDNFPDPARTPQEARTTGHRVHFDGCSSTPDQGMGIVRYVWHIGGMRQERPCRFNWDFPQEGSYPVSLTVEGDDGKLRSLTQLVEVENLLVVSIGDSLGSGQGNPHVPTVRDYPPPRFLPRLVHEAVWDDKRCHRSAHAGSAQAARHIETSDDSTSVTFVHLACSGAQIEDTSDGEKGRVRGGLLDPYEGSDDAFKGPQHELLPPQLDELERLIGDREIDVLLLSVGINDMGFGDIVMTCIAKKNCDEKQEGDVAAALDRLSGTDGRGGRYAKLAGELRSRFPELAGDPARVFINEYPDPTHKDGNLCPSMLAGTIDGEETAWMSEMAIRLNQRVRQAAGAHGWTTVPDVREQFLNNGECADDHWFVRAEESMANQNNFWGTLHPNLKGHGVVRDRFVATLEPRLSSRARSPRIAVVGLATGEHALVGIVPEILIHDPAGIASSSIALDGAPYVSGTPIQPSGTHGLLVKATNTKGRQAALFVGFELVPGDVAVSLPAATLGGTTVTGTVTVDRIVPDYLSVPLSVNGPASVPQSVLVPAGAKSVDFSVTTQPVSQDTPVTVSATAAGITRSAVLTLTPPTLGQLVVSPASVAGGTPTFAHVRLTGPAPTGGFALSFTSDKPAVIPGFTASVPAGESTWRFPVPTAAVTSPTDVVVSAWPVWNPANRHTGTVTVFPGTVTVPFVVEIREQVAVEAILEAGLVPEVTGDSGKPDSHVEWQSPSGGEVPFGSTVELHMRTGHIR